MNMMQAATGIGAVIIGLGGIATGEIYKAKRARLYEKYQNWYDLYKVHSGCTPSMCSDFLSIGIGFSLKKGEGAKEEKELLRKAGRNYLEELGGHGPIDRLLIDNIWYIRSLQVMLATAPLDARLRMPHFERDNVVDWNVIVTAMYMSLSESVCHRAVIDHLLRDPAAFQNDSFHTTNVLKLRRHLREHISSGITDRLSDEDVYWRDARYHASITIDRLIQRLERVAEREEQEEE
jgi:hypothetical protein